MDRHLVVHAMGPPFSAQRCNFEIFAMGVKERKLGSACDQVNFSKLQELPLKLT